MFYSKLPLSSGETGAPQTEKGMTSSSVDANSLGDDFSITDTVSLFCGQRNYKLVLFNVNVLRRVENAVT